MDGTLRRGRLGSFLPSLGRLQLPSLLGARSRQRHLISLGARRAFERFRFHWRQYPAMVSQLERDLPELLQFCQMPRHLWRRLRTTNVIERCFVEVRRRTRPMVVFTNVESVDRIIYAIFSRFNQDWKTRTLKLFTQAA